MTNVQVLSTKADGVAATALTADSDTSGGQGSADGTQGAAMILAIPQEQLAAIQPRPREGKPLVRRAAHQRIAGLQRRRRDAVQRLRRRTQRDPDQDLPARLPSKGVK